MTSFFAALRKALGRPAPAAGVTRVTIPASVKLRAIAHSITGPVRANNEDRVRCVLEEDGVLGERVSLAVVADGMGGHQAGEIAAETAVDVITDRWRNRGTSAHDASEVLRGAIEAANAAVFAASKTRRDWEGMGTTVTALAFAGDTAVVAYVGDSRAYLLREGTLTQLSEDDTLVNHLVRTGVIAAAEASNHPDRGVLSQALGTHARLGVIHVEAPREVCAGDLFMLCSDGVHDVLPDLAIAQHLAADRGAAADLTHLANAIAAAAIAAGTQDNISMVLVEAGEAPTAPLAEIDAGRPTRLVNSVPP